MKKTLAIALVLITALSAGAGITLPVWLDENFWSQAQQGDYPTDGWKTYGNGLVPVGDSQHYFNADGSGPYYVLMQDGLSAIAFCWTKFENKGNDDESSVAVAADQWLVSPEIEVLDDHAMLSFVACTYTNRGNFGFGDSSYKILISETGDTPADFTDAPVYEGAENAPEDSNSITSRLRMVSLNGYKGKKIHLAFVATGVSTGMLGFTDIQLGSYYVKLTNNTKAISNGNEIIYPAVNIEMKVPVECNKIKAQFTAEGIDETLTLTDNRLYNGSQVAYKLAEFESYIDLKKVSVPYTITITPEYEGAPSCVINAYIAVPQATYPNNVVVEELTGTTCQYCPSGAAALEYYSENYPTSDDKHGKAICIAIHDSSVGRDPMAILANEYNSYIMALNSFTGLPQAMFNRKSRGKMPTDKNVFDQYIGSKSVALAEITSVAMDKIDEWTGDFTVNYQVRTGFDIEGFPLRASAVLIENDVEGMGSDYNQANAFNTWSTSQVASQYGQWLVPYMKQYLGAGSPINFRNIKYQHVARGLYPDFDGYEIAEDWNFDVPQDFQIKFTSNDYVNDLENTAVIILVMNPATSEIVASDIFHAKDYVNSGVERVEVDENLAPEYFNLQGVRISAPAPGQIVIIKQGPKVSKQLIK